MGSLIKFMDPKMIFKLLIIVPDQQISYFNENLKEIFQFAEFNGQPEFEIQIMGEDIIFSQDKQFYEVKKK